MLPFIFVQGAKPYELNKQTLDTVSEADIVAEAVGSARAGAVRDLAGMTQVGCLMTACS